MAYENSHLENNEVAQRFELKTDGGVAFIQYKLENNELSLVHTEVPPQMEGKGLGKAIVAKTLAFADEKGYTVIPVCEFVKAYMKRHKE